MAQAYDPDEELRLLRLYFNVAEYDDPGSERARFLVEIADRINELKNAEDPECKCASCVSLGQHVEEGE